MRKPQSYSIEENLAAEVARIARKQGLTVSALVERILKEAVEAYQGVESPFDEMTVFQLIDMIQAAKNRQKKKKVK